MIEARPSRSRSPKLLLLFAGGLALLVCAALLSSKGVHEASLLASEDATPVNLRVCVLKASGSLPQLDSWLSWSGGRSDWFVRFGPTDGSGGWLNQVATCDVRHDFAAPIWDDCCADFPSVGVEGHATLRFELLDYNYFDSERLCCSAETDANGEQWLALTGSAQLDVVVTANAPPPPSPPPPPPGTNLVPPSDLPLRTDSRWIVNQHGVRVKWACVNWAGAAQKDGVVAGLQYQPAARIVELIVEMGFNCVRLPWSVELALQPRVVREPSLLAANPSLFGRTNLEILDAVVAACAEARVMVIIDNHMSDGDWCCSDDDENGLWYNDRWPEAAWIEAHVAVAWRYRAEPYVVAAELRNELRSAVVGGQRLSPDWGSGSLTTDWRAAALRASAEILAVRPVGLLIVVDGLDYSTDLTDIYSSPIELSVANRLVYSTHDYSWSHLFIDKAWYEFIIGLAWGYLVGKSHPYTAPVWVSEIGTFHDGRYIDSGWWPALLSYLQKADFDWAYWSIDGTKSNGTGRTFGKVEEYGLLDKTWSEPASDGVLLQSLLPLQKATQGPGITSYLPINPWEPPAFNSSSWRWYIWYKNQTASGTE